MIFALVWLVACDRSGWTADAAVAPTLARLDKDGDGRVSEAEYDAVVFHGAPFSAVDTNTDGELSLAELEVVIQQSDPASLTVPRSGPQVVRGKNNKPGKGPGGPGANAQGAAQGADAAGGPKPGGAKPAGVASAKAEDRPADARHIRLEAQLVVRMILESLRAEVLSVDPNHAVPDDKEIRAVAGTGDIRTAESRAMLRQLETASDEVKIDFPKALREAELAKVPVTPTTPPADEAEEDPHGGLPSQPRGALGGMGMGEPEMPGGPGGPGGGRPPAGAAGKGAVVVGAPVKGTPGTPTVTKSSGH